MPEKEYVNVLMKDLAHDLQWIENRTLISIFFGGGTPSLFSAPAIGAILEGVQKHISYDPLIEITLETNPGTTEHSAFKEYRQAGVNRISLGAQSFQNDKLKSLGRIHQAAETHRAIQGILDAGFERFNIDLMYGLPNQTVKEALFDLRSAIHYQPPHLSWYHLTLEPNTLFHQYPPPLPSEDRMIKIQEQGFSILKEQYQPYEVSAFAKPGFECQHNVNYWQFGDYLGIGAGAHGKISRKTKGSLTILRTAKTRYPKSYLETDHRIASQRILTKEDLPFEFMLNALRLFESISFNRFEERTGLSRSVLEKGLKEAEANNLVTVDSKAIHTTDLGKRFLNDLISLFMEGAWTPQ